MRQIDLFVFLKIFSNFYSQPGPKNQKPLPMGSRPRFQAFLTWNSSFPRGFCLFLRGNFAFQLDVQPKLCPFYGFPQVFGRKRPENREIFATFFPGCVAKKKLSQNRDYLRNGGVLDPDFFFSLDRAYKGLQKCPGAWGVDSPPFSGNSRFRDFSRFSVTGGYRRLQIGYRFAIFREFFFICPLTPHTQYLYTLSIETLGSGPPAVSRGSF